MIQTDYHADVIVVGSGPGGSTLAKQLSKNGVKVILLEKGDDHRNKWYYGTHVGAMKYTDKMGLYFTKQGLNVIRPIMTGGATNLYCGTSAKPPAWLLEKYHIDLEPYVSQTIDELYIDTLPESLCGKVSLDVMEAGRSLGYDWQLQPKFLSIKRTKNLRCGAHCMLGCRCHGKWTANEYIDKAVASGAQLFKNMNAENIIFKNKTAVGVNARNHDNKVCSFFGKIIIICAGGIGTPLLFQKSGISEAGKGIAMDVTTMVYGIWDREGNYQDPPMTVSYSDDNIGCMFSTLIDPWLLYPIIMSTKGLKYTLHWKDYHKTVGIMIKLKDDISGEIFSDGSIDKPLTLWDQSRLEQGIGIARQILTKLGCKKDSIFSTPLRGTHPSATTPIGKFVDNNLKTSFQNLYICDASVFPEALDRPTVLTIIGFAKRLSDHLLNDLLF